MSLGLAMLFWQPLNRIARALRGRG
jgi:hypothetical protein